MEEAGILWTRWTIRLALALYALVFALWYVRRRRPPVARWLHSLAYGAYLAHVACAFHFQHGWSHEEAARATARDTEETLGFRWAGGIYFNHVFTLLWGVDVARAWRTGEQRYFAPWIFWTVHGFILFMAFQATVVFEEGMVRWSGVAATAVILVLALAVQRKR